MDENTKILIILTVVIVAIVLLGTLFLYVFKINSKCVNDPLTYSAQEYNLVCSCTQNGAVNFMFDKNGVIKQMDNIKYINITNQ